MNREFVSGLAVEAGNLLVRHLGARIVRVKFGTDIVTEADEAAERFIREEVRRHYPGHRVTGGRRQQRGEAEWEWWSTPDGTVNFARATATSPSPSACARGEVRIGVVYRPLTRDVRRGRGVALHQRRGASVSQVDRVEESIVILD